MDSAKKPRRLRSQEWFGKADRDGFMHRSWMKGQGYPEDLFDGRPVIGICNTWSELTPCNGHFRELAEYVKRGVYEAGGFPLEFPVMSLGETQLRPTAMLFRNLASMDRRWRCLAGIHNRAVARGRQAGDAGHRSGSRALGIPATRAC